MRSQFANPQLNRRAYPEFDLSIRPVTLRNISSDCYRNAVLHSLFSIDHFLNLVRWGSQVTGKQIYTTLHDASTRFRRESERIRSAENSVQSFTTLIRTSTARNSLLGESEKFVRSGVQEDAADFLTYLMNRLCKSEIPEDTPPEHASPEDDTPLFRY